MSVPGTGIDRLYGLLPAFHRSADAEQGYPLRALLRVIGEQVSVVEDDIAQLYDDWFIETCAEWVIPYIGDLVGYRPVHAAGEPGDPASGEGRLRNRFLLPRSEVANTVSMRRRKGTLSALAQLGPDVAGWPVRAVEFFRLLAWTQNLNHRHPQRARTIDVHDVDALEQLGGAFDRCAHTAEVRRIASRRRRGRYNVANIAAFVFRMQAYPVTRTPACCVEEEGPHCFTFSVLGNDAPLYTKPAPATVPLREATLPVPIRRFELEQIARRHPLVAGASAAYYGDDKSLAIHAPGWPKKTSPQPIPAQHIVPADLSGWRYRCKADCVAVDPVNGRILFPVGQLPKQGVWVDYHYGFSADIGGGEYARALRQPTLADISRFTQADLADTAALVTRLQQHADPMSAYLRSKISPATVSLIDAWHSSSAPGDALATALVEDLNGVLADADLFDVQRFHGILLSDEANRLLKNPERTPSTLGRLNRLLLEAAYAPSFARIFSLYRVGPGATFARLAEALSQWQKDQPRYGIIEFVDSSVYTEPVAVALAAHQVLQLRAAERARPVLRLLDYLADRPDAFSVSGGAGSRFVLDGLLVAGRGLQISGPGPGEENERIAPDLCEVVIRHCTLVPGWGLGCECEPKRPNEPSIEMINTTAALAIESSVVGSIEITADSVRTDPPAICISDSIVDATRSGRVAISAPNDRFAFARLSIRRTTVLGATHVHAIELAENSIFMGCIHVARRQHGCIRFCYVTPNSRTPRLFHCQPNLVQAAVAANNPLLSGQALTDAQEAEILRVRPSFDSTRYGNAAYCRLALDCATEIVRGADDESEMGVFHDLFQPQRAANLQVRLDEYTPAGMDAGLIYAS
ncbi:MAG TPA: hypothetical protein VFI49_14605 [Rudaea sp.]|nr:hypothetical protein [Rudaea sp.]